jgi:UDP-glucose 4-epimerase
MNVLVTGGAGYVGGIAAERLLRAGHCVTVYDNLSHGKRKAVPAGADLIVGDIADPDALSNAFRRCAPEAVMHFAALIEAGESMKAPERYFRNNSASTLTLLETMLSQEVKRIVFSSTAALYGNPKRTPIEEDDPLCPTNAYGESKLLVERMLDWFHRIHGLRYASLRYFNASGATAERGEDHHPESHLIPLILKTALGQRAEIAIYGTDYPTPDGTCIRDYIHVADLAEAHLLALEALSERGRLVYNLGTGHGFSVREVIEMARRVTGRAIGVAESPRRPGDPAILVASSEKIQQELRWKPQYPDLESVVSSAWEWHQTHPRGYED